MTDPTPCPRCNSWQDFHPKQRSLDTLPWKEVYARCSVCGYELVIGQTTDEIEMLRMRSAGVRRRMQHEMAKHGLPARSTIRYAKELASQMQEAMFKLERDMETINGRR